MIPRIDAETRLMARFHPVRNSRGLNIYNPYFSDVGLNAAYLLFSNPDPSVLLSGMRSLELPGAIVAGSFEKDPSVPGLVDELHPIAESLGTIGAVSNRDGRLLGLYQGGYGLHDSILERLGPLEGRRVVMIGAGNVARALLLVITERGDIPDELIILNRSLGRAERLAERHSFVTDVVSLGTLQSVAGETLINTTAVGSIWCTDPAFVFERSLVERFDGVADVAFVPTLTELGRITLALGKPFAPGHRMFLHQARMVLREVLNHEMIREPFEQRMLADFATNWD